MASVAFSNIEKSFGTTKVIHGITLRHRRRRVHGAGRAVGLRQVDAAAHARRPRGDQRAARSPIDGKVVNDVDSKDRDIAMVFQSYALYPHMTVRDNMGFSLKLRKATPRSSPSAWRARRRSSTSSRTSSAIRASCPAASASAWRWAARSSATRRCSCSTSRCPTSTPSCACAMRAEIKALHQRLKTTTVYVTHDQIEAMTMADRIVVMHDGASSRSARRSSSTTGRTTCSSRSSSARRR